MGALMRHLTASLFVMGSLSVALTGMADEPSWRAGAASVVITPRDSMWMAGYASRTRPSEGKLTELYAKALALQDRDGRIAVIVTTDLIGIPRALREQVVSQIQAEHKIDPDGILMNCSHTHCGPVVKDDLEMNVIYALDGEQRRRIESYFVELRDKLVGVIADAVKKIAPAQISFSHARCGVAMNRRLPTESGFQNSPFPDGPVDHDVPVLRIESPEGSLIAVAFGYACHNTTTGILEFNADYAGYAQAEIEKAHPGAVALFVMGCGGDQNPYPRGKIEWAKTHGASLAAAVEAALLPKGEALNGGLAFTYEEINLAFTSITREELESMRDGTDAYDRRRAAALLYEWETKGSVRVSYPYPVQTIQIGDGLVIAALGGEVVVDYALRLKQELGDRRIWVAGYSNDVMAYIPSERILREGGYEGGGAMRYTNLPGPWKAGIEERIIAEVHRQLGNRAN